MFDYVGGIERRDGGSASRNNGFTHITRCYLALWRFDSKIFPHSRNVVWKSLLAPVLPQYIWWWINRIITIGGAAPISTSGNRATSGLPLHHQQQQQPRGFEKDGERRANWIYVPLYFVFWWAWLLHKRDAQRCSWLQWLWKIDAAADRYTRV